MKARETKMKVGDKLWYTDGSFFGTVLKVLKRDCHVQRPDGTIEYFRTIKMWESQIDNSK